MIGHPSGTVSVDPPRRVDPIVAPAYLVGGLLAGILMELASYTVVFATQIVPEGPAARWFNPGYSAAALVVVAFAIGFIRPLARYGFMVAALGALHAVGLYPFYRQASSSFEFSQTVVMNALYGVVLGGVLLALRAGRPIERGALLAGFAAGLLMNAVLFRSPFDEAGWSWPAEGGLCALIFLVVGIIVRLRVAGPTATHGPVVELSAVVDFVVVTGVVVVAGLAVVRLPVHPDRIRSGPVAVEGNGWLAPVAVAIGLVVVLLVLAVVRGGPAGGLAVLALVAAASPLVTDDIGLRIDWPMVYAAGGGVLVGWLAVIALRAAVPWEVLGYVVAAGAMFTIGGYLFGDRARTASAVLVAGVGLVAGAALTRLAAAAVQPDRAWRLLAFAVATLVSVRTLMYHRDVFRSPVFGWVYGERTHWIWPAATGVLALVLGVIALARPARTTEPRSETQAGETPVAEIA